MKVIVNGKTHYFKKQKVQAVGNFPNGGERFIDMFYRFHKWEIENHSKTESEVKLNDKKFRLKPNSKTIINYNASNIELKSKDKAYIRVVGHMYIGGK